MDESMIFETRMARKVYFTQFTNTFRDNKNITGIEKIVWLTLANYAGEKGHCFPGINKLCDTLGLSVNTLKKHLKSLEQKGGLYICARYDKTTKKQLSNRFYVIDLDYQTGEFDKSLLKPLEMLYPDKIIFE